MKLLLIGFSLMFIAVGCNRNKNAGTEYQKEKQEANREYNKKVQDASQERNKDIHDARKDLQEEQKEEAKDYIDKSDAARVNKHEQEVDVNESKEQK